jgi:hypothetical protein
MKKMLWLLVLAGNLNFVAPAAAARTIPVQRCLPAGYQLTDIVSATMVNNTNPIQVQKVTVAQELTKIRARCRRGKLVDGRNRSIVFYQLQGCWGAFPPNGQQILADQGKALAQLKKRHRVIEMTCNPGGIPYP